MGDKTYSNRTWRTFHDFLFDYPAFIFGKQWRSEQLELPPESQHQLLKWWRSGRQFMDENRSSNGSSPVSGALLGYMDFAYSLYLVDHNVGIPGGTLVRLKLDSQFLDAFYEIYIAGCMIRCGFLIEFEDESDSTRKHCEFTAVFPSTGRHFSVEAKRCGPGVRAETIGRNLKKALKKQADHFRIIALEANLPSSTVQSEVHESIEGVLRGLREREDKEPFSDRTADPAYVFVTNSPYQHYPNLETNRWAVAEGYKIPDFKLGSNFASITQMVESRDRHVELYALMASLERHDSIPASFHGEIPDFMFAPREDRLEIGSTLLVPDEAGKEVPGIIESVAAFPGKREAMCAVKTEAGRLLVSIPLTNAEMNAYAQHPETAFGRFSERFTALDPLDLYDFFLKAYSQSPRNLLLEFMKDYPNNEFLRTLPQVELAKIFAEGLTHSAVQEGHFDLPGNSHSTRSTG